MQPKEPQDDNAGQTKTRTAGLERSMGVFERRANAQGGPGGLVQREEERPRVVYGGADVSVAALAARVLSLPPLFLKALSLQECLLKA